MDSAVVTGLLLVVGWVLVSRRLSRWSVTAPIALLVAGYLLARWGGVELDLRAEALKRLAEVTLVLVLFHDASRVSIRDLRSDASLATRLLAIGLPLTIAAGALVAGLLFDGHSWWVFALVGAILAPTDAALGASIMTEERIPARLRTLINVESGLNDGLATPFVLFFLAGTVIEEQGGSTDRVLVDATVELLIAVTVGVIVGGLGRRALVTARRSGWSERSLEPIAVLALALLSYFACVGVGGNGFVAAFVGGLAFKNAAAGTTEDEATLTEQVGTILGLAVWFSFGLLAFLLVPSITWEEVAYAVLSLTIVRMLPVALALWRSGLAPRDVLLIGWLGPRGLASLVFAILAVEALSEGDAELVAGTVTMTVILSVIAHGLSAGPLARRYAPATAAPP
ncbi:MAG TPA: cation:proton antiporter [Candidatus Limnocylindria bacterium]|nr:cation:proton antiporter [Candidatus Limnocylindria bacterium]